MPRLPRPVVSAPLIEAQGLAVTASGRTILHDIDMGVHPGEILTVVGPNGSGKTTLLRALIGAVRPSRGRVVRQRGLRIGYAPQRLHIDPTMPLTVERFLALGRGHRADIESAARRTGIARLLGAQIAGLSGGELQRVLLARALMRRPGLLILDEPTQGLDQPAEGAFYGLIEAVRDETGAAVLMVSHDLHVVMRASDRVICLNGHICCEGEPARVGAMPEYRALFGPGTQGALALYRHEHDHHHGAERGA